jgi:DNA-binding NtrC family response regulator
VGGSQELQLDLRVISATNRDLASLVSESKFREDLYYRLAVIPLRLPSLRERPDDIMLLATQFLARTAASLGKALDGFDEDAERWIVRHRWPGNVRELENVIERAATLSRGLRITLRDVQTDFAIPATSGNLRPTLAEIEADYIRRVLEETNGDKVAAARILGVSARTLQRRFS